MVKTKKLFSYLLLLVVVISCSTKGESLYDAQIEELISKMTLAEKLGQLNLISDPYISTGTGEATENNRDLDELVRSGTVGNFLNVLGVEDTYRLQKIATEESRLGIPLLFGYDVIHGYKTMFPVPLADAASFDMEAMEKSARYAAMESAANGLNWTYAPMVDISRDPRWGRIMEGAGEDVYLTTKAGEARVKGFQGESLSDEFSIASCAKHFVGYGAAIAGRDYHSADISMRSLYEVYLPPFKAAAMAGAASFMSSFNTVNGEPASGSRWLMRDILRNEWGYDGMLVSDWGSIAETMYHGTANNELEATYNGLNAGVDMDMCGNLYTNYAEELVKSGEIPMDDIDNMVRRVLKMKYRLGLFDNPYRGSAEQEKSITLSKEVLDASRDVAKKSIVLLKNEKNILPISKEIKRIAVIGPLADDKDAPLGNWRAQAVNNSAVSLLDGVKAAVGDKCIVTYNKGCELVTTEEHSFFSQLEFEESDRSGFAAAVSAARNADVVILALGETAYMSGECRSYGDINLKGLQKELSDAIAKTGTPTVMALFTGRPLVLTDVVNNADAILNCWLLGSESGNAIADVLFGEYNPSGKLPATFPYHLGQVPIIYSEMNSGRPFNPDKLTFSTKYRDIPNKPLYAFGHGLSYTTFKYDAIELSKNSFKGDENLTVKVKVSNTGKYDGNEVVQLYIRDVVGKGISRPLIELKGFEKVMIKKGESAEVTFTINANDLAFYRLDKKFAPESGKFIAYVGTASDNLPLEAEFEYTE